VDTYRETPGIAALESNQTLITGSNPNLVIFGFLSVCMLHICYCYYANDYFYVFIGIELHNETDDAGKDWLGRNDSYIRSNTW
jgi:hypothetical protein